ncbi:MAG: hypothetical protein RL701_7840 [Pseudomonadota bacterium]|jgi:hypothetical protein
MTRASLVTEDGRVLVPGEAKALELDCSVPTLWRKVRKGELIPVHLLGRTWFESSAPAAKRRSRRQ